MSADVYDKTDASAAATAGGMLIIISGPSGVGKGTLCRALLKWDPKLKLSVSATTRDPRPGEKQGIDYFFCSDEEFQSILDQNGFLEWAEVHGRRYGTLQDQVQELLRSGDDCILEIDVQGGIQVHQKMGRSCVMIFVKAPSEEELIRRITNRNHEKPEEIKRRMLTAQWEITQEASYGYSVVNDNLNETARKVMDIIRKERIARASAIDR